MDTPDDLVTFDTYPDAVSAHIAKGVLNTNGIECLLTNERMSSIMPLPNMLPIAGVQLLVKRKDLDAAHAIIESNDDPKLSEDNN